MGTGGKIVGWLFGAGSLFLALFMLPKSFFASLVMIIVALFFLPPARMWVYQRNRTEFSEKNRGSVLILGLCLAFILFSKGMEDSRKKAAEAERAAAIQKRNAEIAAKHAAFPKIKNDIVMLVKSKYDAGDLSGAVATADQYAYAHDKDLLLLRNSAREKQLVEEIKKLDRHNISANLKRYRELKEIDPSNDHYLQEFAHYDSEAKNIERELAREIARERKIKEQFSEWDGHHYKLERFLRQNLRDPDSYEHIKTTYIDQGDKILVTMRYRAKNGFGGYMIENIGAYVDINGNIIEILKE